MDTIKEESKVYCKQLTPEEYEIQSKLATQASLFEAGKQTLLRDQKISEREENRNIVKNYLQNEVWGDDKKADAFKKYVNFSEEDILKLTKDLSISQEELDSINDMNEEYIKEIEELEEKLKNMESKYSENIKFEIEQQINLKKHIKKLQFFIFVLLFIIITYTIAYNVFSIESYNNLLINNINYFYYILLLIVNIITDTLYFVYIEIQKIILNISISFDYLIYMWYAYVVVFSIYMSIYLLKK